MVTIDEVAAAAMGLPEVTEGVRYGHRSWAVHGKVFAWERPFSKADIRRFGADPVPEGPILGLSVADLSDKEAVIGAHEAVFTIPHFDGYAAVLVRLTVCTPQLLGELLEDAWLCKAPPALARAHLAER